MKKVIISLILFAVIGAGDLLYTYKNSSSVFSDAKKFDVYDDYKEIIDNYSYERSERKPTLPESSSDFVNKIDCEEYFGGEKDIKHPESGQYLVSHNVFNNNDGSTVTVDITSVFLTKNGKYSGGKYARIVNDRHGSVSFPCAYDSDKETCLKYIYKDHFSLLLDDYNNDGNPDYLIKVGNMESDGAYYYIEYSVNEEYPVHHTNFLTLKKNSDSAVFIYGKKDDSIRLDHTDMNHFFFLTEEGKDAVPYIYDSDFKQCRVSDFSIGNRLYSAFYEDGVLTLRATDCNGNEEIYGDAVTVTVRKLDDRIWNRCGEFTVQFVPDENYCALAHIAKYEQSFEKGLYQLEIKTPDGSAYAEFAVRV